ncbi:MAG: putative ABC transporter permease [Faecalibacterium prausnitzii]|nr:putative ABC transporter permease [Faecalibacterium prausnitzii]
MLSFFVDTTVCGFSLYQVFAYFLIYSCLGWCLEVIYAAVTTGNLINRGFLNGPVCPIYGFGMVIVLFALTPLSHSLLLLYLGGVLLPSALELVGGWALYKLYHTRWWDYSDYPFNIGGYICLEFSLLWGVGTLIVMKLVHPIIANAVALIPPLVGLILMFLLYAIYAADTIATAFAASDLARDLDALEKVADSMHAVSDAMTELLGTNAMAMDQKMDESRLQFKLAAAEARDNAAKLNAREAAAAMRAKADEAMEAAKRASQDAKLNASEAANAVKLAAKGTAERTAELLRLEQLAEELQARSEELRSRTQRATPHFGKRRMLRAFPKLKHGAQNRSLDTLREQLKRK